MSVRDKPPAPMIVKTEKGLRPLRSWDQDSILSDPTGTEYEAVKVGKRKPKQHRTYWKALSLAVKSTDKWASAEHLHEELRLACGFYRTAVNLSTGQIMLIADSTAFGSMDQEAWQLYMDKAMEVLAKTIGYDPLAFIDE